MVYILKEIRLPDGEVMRTHILEPPRVTIGRHGQCDIVIPQKGISKTHAILVYENNYWRIRDVTSNRVYLNQRPIVRKEFRTMHNFDQITLTTKPSLKFVMERQEDVSSENIAPVAESTVDQIMREAREGAERFRAEVRCMWRRTSEEKVNQRKRKATDHGNKIPAKCAKMADTNAPKRRLQFTHTQGRAGPSSANDQDLTLETVSEGVLQEGTNDESADQQKKQAESNEDLLTNELVCAVCTELIVEAATLTCGHSFCNYCIKKWLAKERVCPLCRERFCGTPAKSLIIDNTIQRLLSNTRKGLQEKYEVTKKERKTQELADNQSILPRRMSVKDYLDADEEIPPLAERLRIRYGLHVPVPSNTPPARSSSFNHSAAANPPPAGNLDPDEIGSHLCILCGTHGHLEKDCHMTNHM